MLVLLQYIQSYLIDIFLLIARLLFPYFYVYSISSIVEFSIVNY